MAAALVRRIHGCSVIIGTPSGGHGPNETIKELWHRPPDRGTCHVVMSPSSSPRRCKNRAVGHKVRFQDGTESWGPANQSWTGTPGNEISRSYVVDRERSLAPSGSYSFEKDFRGLRVQLAQCCVVGSREALIVGKARRSLGRRRESLVRPATYSKAAVLHLTWFGLEAIQ
jgi:hypothetical protein